MSSLFDDIEGIAFTWSLDANVGNIKDSREKIHFRVVRNNALWKMDATHIEAALSLWLDYIYERDNESVQEESGNDWLRQDKSLKRDYSTLRSGGLMQRYNVVGWIYELQRCKKTMMATNFRKSLEFTGSIGFIDVRPDEDMPAYDSSENKTSGMYRPVQNIIIQRSQIIRILRL
jgi:hypothetical protein